jgi:hypothetical protein
VLPPLFKTTEGIVIGFLHGPLKKNDKNSGKKIKFKPPPLAPWGAIFIFLGKILEGGQLEFRNFAGGYFSQK